MEKDKDFRLHQICLSDTTLLGLELVSSIFLAAVSREPASLLDGSISWFPKGAEKLHQLFMATFPSLRLIKKLKGTTVDAHY